MSKSENSEKGGPALPCPFCGELFYLREHVDECPKSPHNDVTSLSDYSE